MGDLLAGGVTVAIAIARLAEDASVVVGHHSDLAARRGEVRSALRRSAPTWRPRRLHGPPPEDRGRRQGSARLGGVGRTPLEDRLGAALAYRVGGFPGLGVQGDTTLLRKTPLRASPSLGLPALRSKSGLLARFDGLTPSGFFLGRVALCTTPGPGKRREIWAGLPPVAVGEIAANLECLLYYIAVFLLSTHIAAPSCARLFPLPVFQWPGGPSPQRHKPDRHGPRAWSRHRE